MAEIVEEIGGFDQDYQTANHLAITPNVKDLPDGLYTFEVVKAELTRTMKAGEPILRLILRGLFGPALMVVEHTYFFRTQDNVDHLGADLKAMGFDSDTWNGRHGKRFSAELAAAVTRMAGVQFQGKKEKRGDYHNLYVNACVRGPAAASARTAAAAAGTTPTPAATGSAGRQDKDVPF